MRARGTNGNTLLNLACSFVACPPPEARLAAAGWLLEHGADVNQRATFGGPSHGEGITALHLAAQNGHRAMVELLVGGGADPTIEDAIYKSTPAGWAWHFGAHEVAAYLSGTLEH